MTRPGRCRDLEATGPTRQDCAEEGFAMRKPEYQFFTLEEYRRRIDALRRRMEQKGVDAMLVHTPENLY